LRAALGPDCFHLKTDDSRTDLEKAVEYCLAAGAREVDILAAGGGRADHALADLAVLRLFRGRARVRLVDDLFEVVLVDRTIEVDGPPGTVVSLVAIGRCTGVTTTGLRWPLRDATLEFSPLGVHNEVVEQPAGVSVASGDLLLFKGRWVEHHR
jgi:thiamine pyrophosphokinase